MTFDIKQIRQEVEYIFNSYPRHDMISMSKAQACWLIERVEELEEENIGLKQDLKDVTEKLESVSDFTLEGEE